MKLCDLHTHSVFSDGTCTPAEVIRLAKAANLSAVALTDHNTVAGLPHFLTAAADSGVEAVPGVEFSTDYGEKELHILALFVRPEHYSVITEVLEDASRRKEQSNIDLVQALNRAGYALDYAAIKARTPNGQVNRAHIAAELTRLGYTEDIQAAFKQLLSPKRGLYVPPKRISSAEAIRFIKSLGCTAVLAHPFLNMDEPLLRGFLPEAVAAGLDGMEVAYSKYTPDTAALAAKIAAEFGLKPSGGSDFHGGNKPDIAIGTGRGDLMIPMDWLEALRKAE
ncbi:MAG: PHP domain-containing protein [Ruminococcaceae bacterium]|nr:PHP domain-containing protein [Oscillospiraceae bacterium]